MSKEFADRMLALDDKIQKLQSEVYFALLETGKSEPMLKHNFFIDDAILLHTEIMLAPNPFTVSKQLYEPDDELIQACRQSGMEHTIFAYERGMTKIQVLERRISEIEAFIGLLRLSGNV